MGADLCCVKLSPESGRVDVLGWLWVFVPLQPFIDRATVLSTLSANARSVENGWSIREVIPECVRPATEQRTGVAVCGRQISFLREVTKNQGAELPTGRPHIP